MVIAGVVVMPEDLLLSRLFGRSAAADTVAAEEGFPSAEVRAKIPDDWGPGQAAKKGGGWRWIPTKGNYVRVDPGDPAAPDPLQRVDHVHVTSGGKVVAHHLPLQEWLRWTSWNAP